MKNFLHIIAIHLKRMPSKCFKFFSDVAQVIYFISWAIDLLTVPVYCGNKVVHIMIGGEHDRFPILAFLQLPIAM